MSQLQILQWFSDLQHPLFTASQKIHLRLSIMKFVNVKTNN
ncbi:hypothetical protein [Anaerobacillus alkalilacustris]|nr:hypothetical protein [Anaerobacillus alkalilacustris]